MGTGDAHRVPVLLPLLRALRRHDADARLLAALGTVVWSVVARRTTSYPRLYKWFRLFVRVALGTTMVSYGFAKVFPLQMPTMFLSRLLEGDVDGKRVRMTMTQHDLNKFMLLSRGFHRVQEHPVNR